MTEQWKDIPGYEEMYQASNKGQIRSLDRIIDHPMGRARRRGKVLKPMIGNRSFCIGLHKDGVSEVKAVGHWVLLAFKGDANADFLCIHKNGDPSDNTVDNLLWGTQSMAELLKVEQNRWSRGEPTGQRINDVEWRTKDGKPTYYVT